MIIARAIPMFLARATLTGRNIESHSLGSLTNAGGRAHEGLVRVDPRRTRLIQSSLSPTCQSIALPRNLPRKHRGGTRSDSFIPARAPKRSSSRSPPRPERRRSSRSILVEQEGAVQTGERRRRLRSKRSNREVDNIVWILECIFQQVLPETRSRAHERPVWRNTSSQPCIVSVVGRSNALAWRRFSDQGILKIRPGRTIAVVVDPSGIGPWPGWHTRVGKEAEGGRGSELR